MAIPALPVLATAGINEQINFQGKVVNSDGTNVANGDYSFEFNIYTASSGGVAVWTESKTLTVTDGIFRTNLGSSTTLPGSVDFNTDNIYLGITFDGDGEMSPRVQFTAVPQAFNSDALDGVDGGSFLRSDASDSFTSGTLTFNDSTVLAIGTGNDLQMTHDGTNSTITSATGNLTILNSNTTGVTIAKLGTATSATSFQIQDSSSTALFTVDGAGTLTISDFTTNGGLLYTNGSGVVAQTGAGTANTVLHGGTTPTYGAVDLAADVTGTLPVDNGGTGQTSYTNGQILIGNTTGNTLTKATITGTANQVVVTNGAGSITLSTPQDIATGSSPQFTGLTLTGNLSVQGNTTIGDASGDTLTLNSSAWTVPNAVTWTKTQEVGVAETIFNMGVSDSTSSFSLANGTANIGEFAPTFSGTIAAGYESTALSFFGTRGTATVPGNPAILFLGRYNSGAGNTDIPTTGILTEFRNRATAAVKITGGYNLQLFGTTAVSPTLAGTTADVVSLAGIDRVNTRHAAAGNRVLGLQTERGSAIYLGDDALDFAASTAILSIGGTDLLSLTANTAAFTSASTTATTTSSALVLNANSLTSGTGFYAASSTLTSGKLVDLQVSGTAAAASQTALNILTAGATATNAITTYGAQISNTHTNATSGTNVALYLNASGATTANYGLIVNAGNSGFGNTAPAQRIDVTGTIRQSNATNCALTTNASGDINCTSDVRLKDLHGFYNGGLTQLNQVTPIRFNYKNEDYVHVGFSAQNIQSVLPEGAPIQENGFLGLDSNAVLALTVNSVKQLDAKAASLDDISSLRLQVGELREQLVSQMGDGLSVEAENAFLAKDLTLNGRILFTSDVTFRTNLFAEAVSIAKSMVVMGDSKFGGELTVSDKQAGFAKILKNAMSVEIVFTKELVHTPILQVTPQGESPSFWVDNVTSKGFMLHILSKAPRDIQYAWTAVTADAPQTTVSEPGVVDSISPTPIPTATIEPTSIPPTPTPIFTPNPTPTPEPSVTPSPSVTPIESPTVTPEPTQVPS